MRIVYGFSQSRELGVLSIAEFVPDDAYSPGRLAVRGPSHDSYPAVIYPAGVSTLMRGTTPATALPSASLRRIFAVTAFAQPLVDLLPGTLSGQSPEFGRAGHSLRVAFVPRAATGREAWPRLRWSPAPTVDPTDPWCPTPCTPWSNSRSVALSVGEARGELRNPIGPGIVEP